MSHADLHQILIPYLLAGGATILILLMAVALLRRHGARWKAEREAGPEATPRPT
jgi:hypothetical protein